MHLNSGLLICVGSVEPFGGLGHGDLVGLFVVCVVCGLVLANNKILSVLSLLVKMKPLHRV